MITNDHRMLNFIVINSIVTLNTGFTCHPVVGVSSNRTDHFFFQQILLSTESVCDRCFNMFIYEFFTSTSYSTKALLIANGIKLWQNWQKHLPEWNCGFDWTVAILGSLALIAYIQSSNRNGISLSKLSIAFRSSECKSDFLSFLLHSVILLSTPKLHWKPVTIRYERFLAIDNQTHARIQ